MITFKTRYQRTKAACDLIRDLSVRTTNPVIREYCDIAVTLIASPPDKRAEVDARAVEMLAAAEGRRGLLEARWAAEWAARKEREAAA